jgi:hypothetical protein
LVSDQGDDVPLSLAEYDFKVGHHIRMLEHHARMMRSHAERMVYQPGFPTLAEEELEKVAAALASATETVCGALATFRSKPIDE